METPVPALLAVPAVVPLHQRVAARPLRPLANLRPRLLLLLPPLPELLRHLLLPLVRAPRRRLRAVVAGEVEGATPSGAEIGS
jgi:hypothetical protein